MSKRFDIDLDKAAQLYIESAEAQHGDLELARHEAEDWLNIFNRVLMEESIDPQEEL